MFGTLLATEENGTKIPLGSYFGLLRYWRGINWGPMPRIAHLLRDLQGRGGRKRPGGTVDRCASYEEPQRKSNHSHKEIWPGLTLLAFPHVHEGSGSAVEGSGPDFSMAGGAKVA